MKYYIPTTSLNFNNILSSESISPSAFFINRGYGYSRWTEVPENGIPNRIVLYNSMFKLERDCSEIEDHPLIVEICTDEVFEEIEKGIYVADKTIYLTPWTARFIFLSDKDKQIALSLSDSSLETKMIRLYQKGFVIAFPDGEYPTISTPAASSLIAGGVNEHEIQHDKIINRLKGLMYGYYIGALLSCDEYDVNEYNTLKELQNIFAAVLSNPDRVPTEQQEKRIDALINLFVSEDSLSMDLPLVMSLNKIIGDTAIPTLNLICDKCNISITYLLTRSFLNDLHECTRENCASLKWVADSLGKLETRTQMNKKLLSPDSSEIVVADSKLISIKNDFIKDETENYLFVSLVNSILTDDLISGKISAQRANLADHLTLKVKDILGTAWEASPIRDYLNQLRRHVRGVAFNQEWNNGVLSSLAAVLLKGDDWDILLDYMKRKRMTDYRLAFAFYGLFHGFANLTRDFTDLLLNNESLYVASVYKEFHGSLHGKNIKVRFKLPESERPQIAVVQRSPEKSFREKVIDYFNSHVRKGRQNQSELEDELKRAIDSLGNNEDGYLLVCVLNDYPTWKRHKKAWQKIQQEFCPRYEEIIKSNRLNPNNILQPLSQKSGKSDDVGKTANGVLPGFDHLDN